jgi:putative nucleotidyltransferase with HDIG domain
LYKKFDAPVGNFLFSDNKFETWSGSGKSHHHHYGKSGLIKHTSEVVELALNCNKTVAASLNERELFLACLFHDIGKIYDYEPIDSYFATWRETDHKNKIHHISRSAIDLESTRY